jgi:hypothetical protein
MLATTRGTVSQINAIATRIMIGTGSTRRQIRPPWREAPREVDGAAGGEALMTSCLGIRLWRAEEWTVSVKEALTISPARHRADMSARQVQFP